MVIERHTRQELREEVLGSARIARLWLSRDVQGSLAIHVFNEGHDERISSSIFTLGEFQEVLKEFVVARDLVQD